MRAVPEGGGEAVTRGTTDDPFAAARELGGIIRDLKARVAALEARNARAGVTEAPRGCVCPVGAEATCRGLGCPRREFRMP